MKKTLISLAVVAGLSASVAVQADSKIYGFIDLALVDQDKAAELNVVSTTSAIGFKGSEDLGGGMKAIYKMEFQVDVMNRCSAKSTAVTTTVTAGLVATNTVTTSGCNAITDRDQWLGIKGGMGTVKIGTMSSNYKQKGGKIDPFYRTPVQARSVGQQSNLHSGASITRGRLTNAIQYASPKMGGMQLIANTTISGSADEAIGFGLRYKTKTVDAWFDAFTPGAANADTATKVGVKFTGVKNLTLGLQLEQTKKVVGGDVMFLSAAYKIDGNNTLAFTFGETDTKLSGFNLGVWHKLSKQTSMYAAYNDTSDESGATTADDSTFALGLRKKF